MFPRTSLPRDLSRVFRKFIASLQQAPIAFILGSFGFLSFASRSAAFLRVAARVRPFRRLVGSSAHCDARDDVLTPPSTRPRHLSRVEASNYYATLPSGHSGYIFHDGQSPSMGFTSLRYSPCCFSFVVRWTGPSRSSISFKIFRAENAAARLKIFAYIRIFLIIHIFHYYYETLNTRILRGFSDQTKYYD